MSLNNYEQQVDTIKRLLEKKIDHHYLLKHVESPCIDLDRILMMVIALDQENIPIEISQQYITSAMLVQVALDTHEKVPNNNTSLTERQLTVLAGDLFSGFYYHLLANEENIDLIRTLAHAIKIINEDKIFVYRFEAEQIDSFLDGIKRVETTIAEQFCRHFNSTKYNKLFKEFLLLKRLIKEWDEYKQGGTSILFEGIKKYCLPQAIQREKLSHADQQKLENVWAVLIEKSRNKLIETAVQNPTLPQLFRFRITELANRHKNIAT